MSTYGTNGLRRWVTGALIGLALGVGLWALMRDEGSPAMSQPVSEHRTHQSALKTETGQWKYTNALIKQTSPYLLQHAHNPVNWYAWGSEAFELARRTGKPIFLSIGYSTCYWCHVMERQCFEKLDIAKQMNAQFICIKVDREERPDVDDIYMAATMITNRHGGWPMSVFLTPPGAAGPDDSGLKPFFTGTYFPPAPRQGMPGFPQVMDGIAKAWNERRRQILDSAERIAEAVAKYLSQRDTGGNIDVESVQSATTDLMGSYDQEHGGFGRGQNKFPTPNNLLLLLRVYRNNPDPDLLQALAYTLERMARGGMYDQIGGGFHRYATDPKWLVPHFEKMLYDNGQLIEAYLIAQFIKPDPKDSQLYLRVVRETCDYVLREMTDATGAFWSAQDAEVEAHEGGSYVWTPQQVRDAVGDGKLDDLAIRMYGLDRGTNFQDPHAPNEPPSNVLYLPLRLDELAEQRDMTLEALVDARADVNQRLYAARSQRKQPSTDDKVLVSWNGIMIGGLAMAASPLNEPAYLAAAARAARYILKHMRTEDGGLYRTMRQGTSKINGFLEDYAFFVHGLIELYRSDKNEAWLDAAKQLLELAEVKFGALGGGYYDTLADQPDLFVRTRNTMDGAIPCGNSQMVHNLLDMYELTRDGKYMQLAESTLRSFADVLSQRGQAMAHMQHALLRATEAAPQMVGKGSSSVAPAGSGDEKLAIEVEPANIDLSRSDTTIRVTLRIDEGYHINAHEPGSEYLTPTVLGLENADGLFLQVQYPRANTKQYPFADREISVYEGTVTVQATVRRNGDAIAHSGAKPRLVLSYQMCTEQSCLAPKKIALPVAFR